MQNAPLKATAHRPKRGQRGLPLFLFLFFQSATFSSAPLRTVQERDESAPYDAMTAGDENDVTSGIEPACFLHALLLLVGSASFHPRLWRHPKRGGGTATPVSGVRSPGPRVCFRFHAGTLWLPRRLRQRRLQRMNEQTWRRADAVTLFSGGSGGFPNNPLFFPRSLTRVSNFKRFVGRRLLRNVGPAKNGVRGLKIAGFTWLLLFINIGCSTSLLVLSSLASLQVFLGPLPILFGTVVSNLISSL